MVKTLNDEMRIQKFEQAKMWDKSNQINMNREKCQLCILVQKANCPPTERCFRER